jgi:CSLREA domain-containing protein
MRQRAVLLFTTVAAARAGAIRAGIEGPAESKKKSLAFGLLLMMVALSLLMLAGANPARASTTFTVTNTADPGNGICDASGCTLREAIDAANDTPGKDAIHFNIGGGGVQTIKPKSVLPTIEDAVTIDGYTQTGASKNALTQGTNAVLKIEISGEDTGPTTSGFLIRASNSVVKGLAINRFRGIGLQIGGPGADAQDNRVVGNFIGTDPGGTTDLGNNGRGVVIFSEGTSDNTIGGSRPAGRNLISGNQGGGVGIFSSSSDNAVQGNLIGTKKDGRGVLTNAGNGVFIDGGATDNLIGGTLSGTANTIAFNGGDGVTVGHPDEHMVGPDNSTGNSILRNSIFENGLGIDLVGGSEIGFGTTANDEGDEDEGPNNLQNKPVLTSAATGGGSTTVQGTLNSTPDETFTIQFFSNPPTGGAEGKKYIGSKHVTTNENGNDSFTFSPAQKVPELHGITATATDPDGNTSEFSTAQVVV